MRPARVLHVVNNFVVGGVTRVVVDICNSSENVRYQHSVLALSGDKRSGSQSGLSPSIDVTAVDYEFDDVYSLPKLYLQLSRPLRLRRKAAGFLSAVDALRPDVIHFHTLPMELRLGSLAGRRAGCALVYTDHSTRISAGEYPRHVRRALTAAYKRLYADYNLVPVSASVADYIRLCGLRGAGKHQRLIPNRIRISDWDCRRPYDRMPARVVYVARLSYAKGHRELLRAWQTIGREGHTLLLVGPKEQGLDLEEYARELGTSNVVFTGARSDVRQLLLDSDIGVFPSHKEGLPLALLEMMSAGLPIVASDIPDLRQVLTDGHNALCYKSGDSEDLAAKLRQVIGDFSRRATLGANARLSAVNSHSGNTLAQEYEAFYDEVLADQPSVTPTQVTGRLG